MENKCKIARDGMTILPCGDLFQYHDEKNICLQSFVKDGEALETFYTLQTEKRVGGVVMSFCPFCGGDVSSHITKKENYIDV